MRKIEALMNNAISNLNHGEMWQLSNTMVTTHNGVSHVFLHGNKIAEVGDNFIVLMDGGMQSVTTKSRLNAILSEHGLPGEKVFQKQHKWFVTVNGETVEFFSGMRLN